MGDFQANFARGDAGIHTVEGNVAGSRAAALEKKRLADQQEFEQRKRQIVQASRSEHAQQNAITTKFANAATVSATEKSLIDATIGLVTADEFRAIQQQQSQGANAKDKIAISESEDALTKEAEAAAKKERKRRLKEKKQRMATLSFASYEDEEEENDITITTTTTSKSSLVSSKKKKNGDSSAAPSVPSSTSSSKSNIQKDPTIDTSFLPDKVRDAQIAQERQRLQQQWHEQQEIAKREQLEIVYSYWDGSGHRRSVTVRKGDTVETFLELVRLDLSNEFRELQSTSSDTLLYIKEDLIIPHDITFYDLIVTKARGKSGPLFHFDIHDDVRVGAIDVRIEKDESHPGKIVQRHWYERNKHIFPASRWEIYDPTKEYGTYTIGGN